MPRKTKSRLSRLTDYFLVSKQTRTNDSSLETVSRNALTRSTETEDQRSVRLSRNIYLAALVCAAQNKEQHATRRRVNATSPAAARAGEDDGQYSRRWWTNDASSSDSAIVGEDDDKRAKRRWIETATKVSAHASEIKSIQLSRLSAKLTSRNRHTRYYLHGSFLQDGLIELSITTRRSIMLSYQKFSWKLCLLLASTLKPKKVARRG